MQKTEKIPVLILSGTMVPLDEARFKASGARGVLFKPFESRELLEKIELLLREETAVPESRKPLEAPAVDERWDFSDVLDEVEAEVGKSAASAQAARDGLLPGAILSGGARTPNAFNEFDVSIDEIEGSARGFPAEPTPPAFAPKVEHMECDLPADSPPPVTDLSPALDEVDEVDEVEEIEEIEHLDDVEVSLPPADAVSTETPASLRILPAEPAQPVIGKPIFAEPAVMESIFAEPAVMEATVAEPAAEEQAVVEPALAMHAVEEPYQVRTVPSVAIPDAVSRPGDAELREFFSGRAAEIFRTVASEAVEKVMWEMTDRLAAEFSAKLRESVEAVAWEVIPSTAEALIREEIARIRGKAGKPSS
jgi:CheY-like chemotaxis protein